MALTRTELRIVNTIFKSYTEGAPGPWTVKFKKAPDPETIVLALNALTNSTRFRSLCNYDTSFKPTGGDFWIKCQKDTDHSELDALAKRYPALLDKAFQALLDMIRKDGRDN